MCLDLLSGLGDFNQRKPGRAEKRKRKLSRKSYSLHKEPIGCISFQHPALPAPSPLLIRIRFFGGAHNAEQNGKLIKNLILFFFFSFSSSAFWVSFSCTGFKNRWQNAHVRGGYFVMDQASWVLQLLTAGTLLSGIIIWCFKNSSSSSAVHALLNLRVSSSSDFLHGGEVLLNVLRCQLTY